MITSNDMFQINLTDHEALNLKREIEALIGVITVRNNIVRYPILNQLKVEIRKFQEALDCDI